MADSVVLSLRRGIAVVELPPEQLGLRSERGELTLGPQAPGLAAALRMLATDGATEDELTDLVLAGDGGGGLARLYYWLRRWGRQGLLCYGVRVQHEAIATVVPMTPGFLLVLSVVEPETRFRLSRFAYCRREGEQLVLESPLADARVLLPGQIGPAVVAELANARTCLELSTSIDALTEGTARSLLKLLEAVAMVGREDGGTLPEDRDAALAQWEFHDLLFHSRSRPGTHDLPIGATFRFAGSIAPLPALKAPMSDDAIPLRKPVVERCRNMDAPLTRVMEDRRSIRDYGSEPITVEQLGEFLFHTARVRQIIDTEPAPGARFEASSRPYPSGGAAYDLEVYVTANRCAPLAIGIYHYDPSGHALYKLTGRSEDVARLVRDARLAGALSGEPQVLVTLTSRFQRLSWKYSGLAYATTLKNVGVLFQSMYLVATAMGLAPCALGSGDPTLFSKAVGLDPLVESSVGEFLLGTRGSPTSITRPRPVQPDDGQS